MIPKCILLILASFTFGGEVQACGSEEVGSAFTAYQVVPNVIPKPPKECAYVKYPNELEAQLGNELAPVLVQDVPAVLWNANPDNCYLLAMVDPDVPSRAAPTEGQVLHWLVGNIPGDYLRSKESSDILAEYVGPTPGPFSDLHRYVILIYQQPSKLKFDEPRLNDTSLEGRYKFSIQEFATKYNLGNPTAGNFYQARYDPYVPFARAELGDYSLLPCLTGQVVCK